MLCSTQRVSALLTPVAFAGRKRTVGEIETLASETNTHPALMTPVVSAVAEVITTLGSVNLLINRKAGLFSYLVPISGILVTAAGYLLQPLFKLKDLPKEVVVPQPPPIQEKPPAEDVIPPEAINIKESGSILNKTRKLPAERMEHGEKLKCEFFKDLHNKQNKEIITHFVHALLKDDPKKEAAKKNNNIVRRYALVQLAEFINNEISDHSKKRIIASMKAAVISGKISEVDFKIEVVKILQAIPLEEAKTILAEIKLIEDIPAPIKELLNNPPDNPSRKKERNPNGEIMFSFDVTKD